MSIGPWPEKGIREQYKAACCQVTFLGCVVARRRPLAMATVWTSAMSLLAEMGLGAAIIQFRALEESELNTCFWLTMGVTRARYFILYGQVVQDMWETVHWILRPRKTITTRNCIPR